MASKMAQDKWRWFKIASGIPLRDTTQDTKTVPSAIGVPPATPQETQILNLILPRTPTFEDKRMP
eukprot:5171193-Pyramimonas_sp.AAC.1